MTGRRFLVQGEVQGVGFRYFVLRRAGQLGLVGWARNLPDGRVEVVARGDLPALARLAEALGEGPQRARVTGVESSEISDEEIRLRSFEIR